MIDPSSWSNWGEVNPTRCMLIWTRRRSRARSARCTSRSRCFPPSYSWIRQVPTRRRSARATKLPHLS